ncbi:MAG: glycosyltransferase family 61 protein [Candidatus Brocadiales bacterium]|nr:glycosyltransferase family 61 protein [Candidatus Brocadiales bacterium]
MNKQVQSVNLSDEEMVIDFSQYSLNQFAFDSEKSVLLKYYSFSEKERRRPPVLLEDPVEDTEIFSTQQSKDPRSGYPEGWSLERYNQSSTEEAFVVRFKEMFVGPGGMVLDPKTNKSYYHGPLAAHHGPWVNNRSYKVRKIDSVFPLLVPWGWSWQHFIPELLDQLVFAKDILIERPDVKILIDGPPQFDSFWTICRDVLGLRNDYVHFSRRVGDPDWDEILHADEIIYCHFAPIKKGFDMVPKMIKWVRAEFISTDRPMHERDKVIYISRAAGPKSGKRQIENQTDVINAMTALVNQHEPRWEVVEFSPPDYNLFETMDLFSKARAVVCLIGGANANLLFAPPQTVVIECIPAMFPLINFFGISGAVGHKYWSLPISGASTDDQIIKLPLDKIIRTLKKSLCQLNGLW